MSKRFLQIIFFVTISSCAINKSVQKNHEELVLNGKITRNDLMNKFPWFQDNYNRYHPKDSIIDQIKNFPFELKVIVFMGTWCDDSKDEVPKFFKIADALHLYDAQMNIIALDRNKHCDSVDISPYKITLVPTFIFYKDGNEIGRIIEGPRESIENDLLKMMNDAK